jgi:hypothetical protein
MIEKFALATLVAFSVTAAPAFAQTPAPAPAPAAAQPGALTVDTPISELATNPDALAILQRELPQLAEGLSRVPPGMTLRSLSDMAKDYLSPEKLAAIGSALAALPH